MTIALITPLKDELENLPRLYASIGALTCKIDHWVICENGSTDGSVEFLESAEKPANVGSLHILHIDTGTVEYQLGFKYSRIVDAGLSFLYGRNECQSVSYIGILDADCFPHPDYYDRLIEAFESRDRLGIVSGTLISPAGVPFPSARGFPRGNSRLWRRRCLEEAPYLVGMSADTLSAIRAEARGWICDALAEAKVETRDIGHRAGQKYYGKSAYYRGETLPFTALKCARRSLNSPSSAFQYLTGYVGALLKRDPKVEDKEILDHSRSKLPRLLGFSR